MPPEMSIVGRLHQERMRRYKAVLALATTPEERKAILKAYEIARLIFIKDEDTIERSSFLL